MKRLVEKSYLDVRGKGIEWGRRSMRWKWTETELRGDGAEAAGRRHQALNCVGSIERLLVVKKWKVLPKCSAIEVDCVGSRVVHFVSLFRSYKIELLFI